MNRAPESPAANSSRAPSKVDTLAVRGGDPPKYRVRRGHHAHRLHGDLHVRSAPVKFAITSRGTSPAKNTGATATRPFAPPSASSPSLEGAEDAVLFPSGMNAVTTLLLSMVRPGDHIVMTSDCYRRTRQFVTAFLGRFGVEHTLVDPDDVDALEACDPPRLDPRHPLRRRRPTRICASSTWRAWSPFAESIRASSWSSTAPWELPSTFALSSWVPILVVHSCSKYLGGHNDLLAGAVCGIARHHRRAARRTRSLGRNARSPWGLLARARYEDAGGAHAPSQRQRPAAGALFQKSTPRSSVSFIRDCRRIPITPSRRGNSAVSAEW